MANKRINKSEAVYDHDCFDNYFYSDPEKENSWALNDLCATIDDCHLEHTGEVDNQDYVECCTTLPDGTEVAVSVGICDDGTGDNDLHELASYNIDVGDNVGPGVIREWDKAYKIDEIPEMWQDLWNDLDKLIAEHSANESLNKGKTMKSESIEDLKDKSVSWGTMRSEDLIPKFLGVLKQYAPDNYDAYVKANPEVLDLKGMDDETLGWVVDELFDELDKIAPEGTYFGAHPDDGADYGFWSVEESKQREAKKSEAYGEREACPKCGSKHIHDLKVSRNGDDLEADIACDDCGHTWYDNYSFSGAYVDGSNKKYYEPITKCPKCGGSNLEVSISDDACEDFKCKDCGTVWYNSFVWDDLHNESFKKPAAEAKKSEGLSIDDYAKYNMDHYAAKAAGWTWDDENSCYVDKDGIVVEWDSSDAVMIDPIEYDGHTYEQVNVWGDGTVEFQDETGVSENWAEFDDELVGKIYAALGGKVGEAYEPRMTPPWGPEDMEYTQAELTGEDVLGDFFLQALQYLRKDLGYSYDLKQERHLLTKLTRLFDKGLDYKKAIDTILSDESFCARTGIRKPAAEAKKSEGLSIDDYAKYNMDHYAAKAAGWTWDDENSCYVDKDGIVVEWDSSDAVMIDPIEYDGHTYEQVNVWGDGTVEFQDETGVSENWAEFDDELVGKIYAALGGKVGEAYEPRMTPPWGPEDMEYTQAELTGEDVLGDFFLQALQYLRKDLGYSYDLKQERHLLTKLTRLFDKGLDYKKAIDTILSDESFCARTGIRKPAAEAKKPEAYEDIWRGAKVVSYEDAADYITLPAEEEQKIIDKYGKDYYDNPDAMNEYAEALDDYIVAMFDQDFVYIDGDEIPLAVCREPKILIVQTIDHIDGDKAVELVKKLANGELTGSSEDGDFVAIMDGVNGSPHFDIYSEEPKSEGKSDKDGKDDKDCKGKGCDGSDEKCGGDKKKENRGKPQEGPGAGYDVTFEDVDVKDVSVTFNEAKDAFDVALKISARMNAEGYDWDTQYYREHMGYEPEDDEITLKFSLPNSSLKQDWADMDMADASIEEKVKALDEAFHNVDLQKFGYGGGWSHSGFHPGYVDNVLVYPFEYDGAYIEPCQSNSSLLEYNTYIPLEMDVQGTFAQDVEGACNYGSDLYDFTEKVRDIVKDLLPEQEISDSDISDERCEDYFTGGWDAEDAANEIADELRDSSESKKSESKKSEGNYQDWISFAYAMYASRLRTLARKLVSFGFDVEDDVNIKDENKNDKSAEYSLYAKKDGKTYEINVDIYEGKHTTITIKADNKVVVQGEGSSFASALSTIDANDIGESNKSESEKNEGAYLDGSMSNAEFMSKLVDNAPNSLVFNKDNNSSKNTYTISANPDFGKSSRHALIGLNADDDKYEVYTYLYNNDAMTNPRAGKSFVFKVGSDWNTFITAVKELFGFVGDYIKSGSQTESKKSESLTLKQKELKDMVLYGEAEDITGISDAEAKELRKNGIETVGVSRGVYGMNGALLRGSDGKLYAITARSSNLFYFV